MVIKKATTASSRKHAFKSFRDRVDSIKIEPALNLGKKPSDFVEISYFLTAYTHWKDVNISGGFKDFSKEVKDLIQTLPQLIYHQDELFDSLCTFINNKEIYSLEPLLDMLSQFCHDLGPDFMKFFNKSIELLSSLVLDPEVSSNSDALEWTFNCMAYLFKYLSRSLTGDLVPIIKLLTPLLELEKKDYISRFAAESLSFLIRKLKQEALENSISYTFNYAKDSFTTNSVFRRSIVTMYAESMQSISQHLHSKTSTILKTILLHCRLHDEFEIGIAQDIILLLLGHAKEKHAAVVYQVFHKIYKDYHSKDDVKFNIFLLFTLVFAESGSKVPDWNIISEDLLEISSLVTTESSSDIQWTFTKSVGIFVRNCELVILVKSKTHTTLFEKVEQLNEGSAFLPFAHIVSKLSRKRFQSLFGRWVQGYINNNWSTHGTEIFIFLQQFELDGGIPSLNDLTIPISFAQDILNYLESFKAEDNDTDSKRELYWRLKMLKYAPSTEPFQQELSKVLLNLLENTFLLTSITNKFDIDICGIILEYLPAIDNFPVESFLGTLEVYKTRVSYLRGLFQYLKVSSKSTNESKHVFNSYFSNIIESLTSNLTSANQEMRYLSLQIISELYSISPSHEIPQIVSECRIFEEIPVTVTTSRDLQIRLRNIAAEFNNTELTPLIAKIIPKFLFGIVTNNMNPITEGAQDAIVTISGKHSDEIIWTQINEWMSQISDPKIDKLSFDNGDAIMDDTDKNNDSGIINFNFNNFNSQMVNTIDKYVNFPRSLYEITCDNFPDKDLALLRSRAISVLIKLPSLAESHSALLTDYILDDSWSTISKNGLLKVFSKFKKLTKVKRWDELNDYILTALSSVNAPIQNLALKCILQANGYLKKYEDDFKNLLDSKAFSDELIKFVEVQTPEDEEKVIPILIRILFGRVQTAKAGGTKQRRKSAIILNLGRYKSLVRPFINLISEKVGHQGFFISDGIDYKPREFDASTEIIEQLLRRQSGFVNLSSDIIDAIGKSLKITLTELIQPLLFTLFVAQKTINLSLDEATDEKNLDKIARANRSTGMKNLSDLFSILPEYDWDQYFEHCIYSQLVLPRLPNFSTENLQQPSALMKLIASWALTKNYYHFLYFEDFKTVKAIIGCIGNPHVKDNVLFLSVTFASNLLKAAIETPTDENLSVLSKIISDEILNCLPTLFNTRCTTRDISRQLVNMFLTLTEGNFSVDSVTKNKIILAARNALERRANEIDNSTKVHIIKAIMAMIDTDVEDITKLIETTSKILRFSKDKNLRNAAVNLLKTIAEHFHIYREVSDLIEALNSYSQRRLDEPDFDRRLEAFTLINEDKYKAFSTEEWLPILYSAFYFLEDEEELPFRRGSNLIIQRFISRLIEEDEEGSKQYVKLFVAIGIANLKKGVHHKSEIIRTEYISILSYWLSNSKWYTELDAMKVLLFEDDESNFFKNVYHVQVGRRQKALHRLGLVACELSPVMISHYIIPAIEPMVHFVGDKRPVAVATIEAIGQLVLNINWAQYKDVVRRYASSIQKPDLFKDIVLLLVSVSHSLMVSARQQYSDTEDDTEMSGETEGKKEYKGIRNLPSHSDLDNFITKQILPPLAKLLRSRDEETLVDRIPLSEAMSYFAASLSPDIITSTLPGILTDTCQILRSRSDVLRNAVRASLAKISRILGPTYLLFILKELKSALKRGSQIHILSFTVHYILVASSENIKHGDLDPCAEIVADIIMKDAFGAAGKEKDAEGYRTTMIEVRQNKSYDTAELIASNVSISKFKVLFEPIRYILLERLSLKTERKIDEIIRRYSLGLYHNENSSNIEVLKLCDEIYKSSIKSPDEIQNRRKKEVDENKEHFIVRLNAKAERVEHLKAQQLLILQRLAFDILRSILSRHVELITESNISTFMPYLHSSLRSENENVIISSLKLLTLLAKKAQFTYDGFDGSLKGCSRETIVLIKDCPTTTTELSQNCLKFLSTILRHRPLVEIKENTIIFVIEKIKPDLQEKDRQGLAFTFLRAVLSRKFIIPEIYKTMEPVSETMITSHTKEIRDMSRSVYFQFLREYPQSSSQLEKHFRFLVSNLEYPSQTGRESVMELLHLFLVKYSDEMILKMSSSFFVALANVSVCDDASKCRKMASSLLTTLFKRMGKQNMGDIEEMCSAWIDQNSNTLLTRCGLQVYKIYVTEFGVKTDQKLDKLAFQRITHCLDESRSNSTADVEWEVLYTCLITFGKMVEVLQVEGVGSQFKNIWANVIVCLLYPHSWVRSAASKLVGVLLLHIDEAFKTIDLENADIQTIANRSLRQLNAPNISEDLETQIVKNLIIIITHWEEKKISFDTNFEIDNEQPMEKSGGVKFDCATDWLISRLCGMMRQEVNLEEFFFTKKGSIQLIAMIAQILDKPRLMSNAELIILALYNFTEDTYPEGTKENELKELCDECLVKIQENLETSEFLNAYSKVKQQVNDRRQERKSKRARLAVEAPDVIARRKLRKHERHREKRKHEKDENGYYRSKKVKPF